jgi:dihydropyrimidine dehydrogenase (NAD+) subunit PreA
MANLNVKFLEIKFPNPFILASAPPTANGKMVIDAFEHGWGGVVLKTIGLEPTRHPSPRLYIISDSREKNGMVNIELISEFSLATWLDEIDAIRDRFPDHPIIASIMGGGNPFDWQEVEHQLEKHGVNGFEMNVSCPNFAEHKGAQLGQDPDSLRQAVQWVREASSLPVIVKLTPNVTDIVSLARVAKEAGADAVTATNTLSGLAGIDLNDFKPLGAVDGRGIFGGYSGPGLRPVSLRCAASIARAVDIPIIGCGGITNWQNAAEFLSIGCSIIEVCTAVMWNGFGIINKFTNGLSNYLDKHGFSSPTDIIGKALPNLVQYPDLDLQVRLVANVDVEKCNGCVFCSQACSSAGYQAIEVINQKAVISLTRCDGCGLCIGLCPMKAISMALKDE